MSRFFIVLLCRPIPPMIRQLNPFLGVADNGAAFARTVLDVHGEAGQEWLNDLPSLLIDYAQRWSLKLLPPFALSYHYVAPAIRTDGTPAVLKAGVPSPDRNCEILALQLCNGNGMARVLEADAQQGVLLIERLLPGTTLASLEDDAQATLIAAQVMRHVWQPLPADHPFPSVGKWAKGLERLRQTYDGGTGPLPQSLVDLAERLFDELLTSAAEPVLLHGDLHHFNILAAERQTWLAIDPQGVAGEPAYEVGALLRNPFPQLPPPDELARIQARRVEQLAEVLGFDREQILAGGSPRPCCRPGGALRTTAKVGSTLLPMPRRSFKRRTTENALSAPVLKPPRDGQQAKRDHNQHHR